MAALFDFSERKFVRAGVIADYCRSAGYRGCVCFSCGNASRELRKVFPTVDVSKTGGLLPTRWWLPAEIHWAWPDLFDATSGHLPMPLLVQLADVYRSYLSVRRRVIAREYVVPTGSGETILALRLAFPDVVWIVDYGTGMPGACYEPEAPLNGLIRTLFDVRMPDGTEKARCLAGA